MRPDNSYNLDLIKTQLGLGSDLSSAAAKAKAKPESGKASDAASKRWQAARDFESMFMGQMYKAMRKSNAFGSDAFGSDLTEASPGREIFTEMLDQEYAKQNAKSPLEAGQEGMRRALSGVSNSLAAQIYRALMRNDKEASASVTGGDVSEGFSPLPGLARVLGARRPYALGARPAPVIAEKELNELIDAASKAYGVSRDLIQGVIKTESANRPQAVSLAGAKGLMQLMDSTAKDLGVSNVFNPRENVLAGTRYLKQMLDRYQGDEKRALAAYNAGPAQVDRYQGIPPFAETKDYVERVLKTRDEIAAARGKE